VATSAQDWLATNPFEPRITQYRCAASVRLVRPTADTTELITQARRVLAGLYRAGIRYHRVGVMLCELTP
jgi:DNA polymerase V